MSQRTLFLAVTALCAACITLAIALGFSLATRNRATETPPSDAETPKAIDILATELLEQRREQQAREKLESAAVDLDRFMKAALAEKYFLEADAVNVNGELRPFVLLGAYFEVLDQEAQSEMFRATYMYWMLQDENFGPKSGSVLTILRYRASNNERAKPDVFGTYDPENGFIAQPQAESPERPLDREA